MSSNEREISPNKSRAKYQCPPRLSKLIEQVNRLITNNHEGEKELLIGHSKSLSYYQPAIDQIEDFGLFVEQHNVVLQKAFNNYYQPHGFDAVKDIDLIVEDLLSLITSGYGEVAGLSEDEEASYVIDWFDAFASRNGSKALVKNFKTAWTTIKENKENLFQIIERYSSIKKRGSKSNLSLVKVQSKIVIQDNKINVILPEFFEIINGIDLERLRICKICSLIFWAVRKDSETCSLPCANNLRVRRHRNSNYTKVKKMLKELDDEQKILEKLELNLDEKNSLIARQRDRVNELAKKIQEEKNGTL